MEKQRCEHEMGSRLYYCEEFQADLKLCSRATLVDWTLKPWRTWASSPESKLEHNSRQTLAATVA